MKKPVYVVVFYSTLLILILTNVIGNHPNFLLALSDEPNPADPSDEPPLDSVQQDQNQKTATTNDADGFVYALRDVNGSGNLIYGFKADALTGSLTSLPGFPMTTGGLGTGNTVSELMTYDPVYGHLYVVNNGSNTISAYAINRTNGNLTELPYSPFTVTTNSITCITIHPNGSPLIIGDSSNSNIISYNITPESVSPASGSPFGSDVDPFSCVFSQNGSYLYAGGNLGTDISGFSVDTASGILSPLSGSPFASGVDWPAAYVTDSSGRLFSASISAGEMVGFTTSAGVPTAVSGNPFASGLTGSAHGVLHPAGFYMVADRDGDQVGVFEINDSGSTTSLAMVPGSPFPSGGTFTDVLALSRTAAFLFAANGDSRNITIYAVNAGTGSLSITGTQAVNTLGNSGRITGMAFIPILKDSAPPGGFIYALQDKSGSSNQVYGFQVDTATGILKQISGFPIATGNQGIGNPVSELMTYDGTNSRLFVVNNGSNTVSVYSVNRQNGTLTELSFSPFSIPLGVKGCIAVHPSGSPLVIGFANSSEVASFNITPNSAVQATGSPYNSGAESFSCTFNQDGAYLYAGGDTGDAIGGLAVDAASGVLTPLIGSPYASGENNPLAYVTDNSGRLFSANYSSGQIRVFTTSSGIPTAASGSPFASGLNGAVYSILHPDGFLMTADRLGNQVGVYKIAGSGAATTLTAVSGSPFPSGGFFTGILALNEDGRYLFAANSNSRNITSYLINESDGSLTGVSIQPINTVGQENRITGMAYVPPLELSFLPVITWQ